MVNVSSRLKHKAKMQLGLTRRVITDTREKMEAHGEIERKVAEVEEEQRAAKDAREEELQRLDAQTRKPSEPMDTWKPPQTLSEFMDMVQHDHPEWPWAAQHWQARKLFERCPLIEKAFLDGLAMGRDLRERREHGLGWWWDSLEPLIPMERTVVLDRVSAVILRDKPKKDWVR